MIMTVVLDRSGPHFEAQHLGTEDEFRSQAKHQKQYFRKGKSHKSPRNGIFFLSVVFPSSSSSRSLHTPRGFGGGGRESSKQASKHLTNCNYGTQRVTTGFALVWVFTLSSFDRCAGLMLALGFTPGKVSPPLLQKVHGFSMSGKCGMGVPPRLGFKVPVV